MGLRGESGFSERPFYKIVIAYNDMQISLVAFGQFLDRKITDNDQIHSAWLFRFVTDNLKGLFNNCRCYCNADNRRI